MISATVGGITFSSDPVIRFGITSFDGWRGSPPVKTQLQDRANSDGMFGVSKFLRGARPITLAGRYTGTGEDAETYDQYDALAALLADGAPTTLTVTDPGGTASAQVILYGDGSTLTQLVNGLADYVITFVAPDPVKYGPAKTYSTGLSTAGGGLEYNLFAGGAGGTLFYGALGALGRVSVVNTGHADVWPVFSITGGLDSGFFIQWLETGQVLRYDRVVPLGTFVQLDSRTGEVLIDGVSDSSTYLTRDEWFAIPAKGSATLQLNAIGGSTGLPLMTVSSWDGSW